MTKRILFFACGVASYLVFFGTFLYAVGLIGGFAVPTTLDGPARGPLGVALAINTALLGLFAVQHSVMARPAFKRWMTRFIPAAAERSTYVLASSLAAHRGCGCARLAVGPLGHGPSGCLSAG